MKYSIFLTTLFSTICSLTSAGEPIKLTELTTFIIENPNGSVVVTPATDGLLHISASASDKTEPSLNVQSIAKKGMSIGLVPPSDESTSIELVIQVPEDLLNHLKIVASGDIKVGPFRKDNPTQDRRSILASRFGRINIAGLVGDGGTQMVSISASFTGPVSFGRISRIQPKLKDCHESISNLITSDAPFDF